MESIVKRLANSRNHELLSKINAYPVLSIGAHTAPFPHRWMNMSAGIVFPIGLLLYARATFFRYRLTKDIKQIVKTNKEILNIINERKY